MAPRFDNSYAALPPRFFTQLAPEPVSAPRVLRINAPLARQLGFDPEWLASDEGAQVLAGNAPLAGSSPIATVYAGHQFGHFNPRLGDGRALLLGEVLDVRGERYDIQLKGSGRTPYSRGGDGRSPLGPVLREYVVSEAMAALGIPTTRSLAAVATGDRVFRETVLPGAVLTRVARSHIRVGTFEYFASRQDVDGVRTLVEHVLARHYPELQPGELPPLTLLDAVVGRQAELVAMWQSVGFIHGVMNTDNTLVSGETIDYGPCAFMNGYDPATVYSSIDHMGRYAYANQPRIAQWNLMCLARALLSVTGTEAAVVERIQAVIDSFPDRFAEALGARLAHKLGLPEPRTAQDLRLIEGFEALLQQTGVDFTLALRKLSDLAGPPDGDGLLGERFALPEAFDDWLALWRGRVGSGPELQAELWRRNPVFIPRNHQVERVIEAAVQRDDLQPFHALVEVLSEPFDFRPERADYARPPLPEERVQATFCGT